MDKMTLKIRKCWQAGDTLSKAYKYLNKRFGFTDKQLLIKEWRIMKKRFGCASLPMWYLCGLKQEPRPKEMSSKELSSYVGSGLTYGQWKGITGAGAKIKSMLDKTKESVL